MLDVWDSVITRKEGKKALALFPISNSGPNCTPSYGPHALPGAFKFDERGMTKDNRPYTTLIILQPGSLHRHDADSLGQVRVADG